MLRNLCIISFSRNKFNVPIAQKRKSFFPSHEINAKL